MNMRNRVALRERDRSWGTTHWTYTAPDGRTFLVERRRLRLSTGVETTIRVWDYSNVEAPTSVPARSVSDAARIIHGIVEAHNPKGEP